MYRCLFSSVEGEEFCDGHCLSIPMAFFFFRFPVVFRLSVQLSTVLVHLVATGRVSPSSGISSVWPIRNVSSSLNCIAAVPTVFCVCKLGCGSTEFSDAHSITWEVVGSVNSCGRRCCFNAIENVAPRWFCRLSRYVFNSILNATNRSWDSSPVSQIEFDCISS